LASPATTKTRASSKRDVSRAAFMIYSQRY
jgi:hypothetical protein